mmetsp:Transcript_130389/g.418186  ORF Transcript_130389/g.418186 Transcript_130389/m.418186 type:complete len:232 (+) Transcript_130389:126-821(+)
MLSTPRQARPRHRHPGLDFLLHARSHSGNADVTVRCVIPIGIRAMLLTPEVVWVISTKAAGRCLHKRKLRPSLLNEAVGVCHCALLTRAGRDKPHVLQHLWICSAPPVLQMLVEDFELVHLNLLLMIHLPDPALPLIFDCENLRTFHGHASHADSMFALLGGFLQVSPALLLPMSEKVHVICEEPFHDFVYDECERNVANQGFHRPHDVVIAVLLVLGDLHVALLVVSKLR